MIPPPKQLGTLTLKQLLTMKKQYLVQAQRLRNLGQSEYVIQDFVHRAYRIEQHLAGEVVV